MRVLSFFVIVLCIGVVIGLSVLGFIDMPVRQEPLNIPLSVETQLSPSEESAPHDPA